MNHDDELRDVWCSQPSTTATSKEDLMELVEKKTQRFDRMIRVRNLAECVSALAVAALFTAMALHSSEPMQRTGNFLVAASGLWIIYFLLRFGQTSAPADPGQPLTAYRSALVERYDRQISLLKSVKYWYLLPPWTGLMIGTISVLQSEARKGRLGWNDFLDPAIYTAVFAFIWWLNEALAVPRLRADRDRVLAHFSESPDDLVQ